MYVTSLYKASHITLNGTLSVLYTKTCQYINALLTVGSSNSLLTGDPRSEGEPGARGSSLTTLPNRCRKCGDPIPDEDTLCAYCDYEENPEYWEGS